MSRRALAFAACVFAWCVGANAQQAAKTAHVGYLAFGDPSQQLHEAFRQGLRELGYVEGRTVAVEYRFAQGRVARLDQFAEELVRLGMDVIVAPDPPSFRAAMKATTTIPIVMRSSTNPVSDGIVASFARPGGNVTGVFSFYSELNGKRLELLKEAVPTTSRVMVLLNSSYGPSKKELENAETAARPLNLRLLPRDVRGAAELEDAFRAAMADGANGLLVLRSPLFVTTTPRIASLAAKARLPAVYDDVLYVEAGGLMSYGADLRELYRHTATYVDRILKGAKPGELPIEQPTKLELIVSLKSARALGVRIPQSVLLRTDKALE